MPKLADVARALKTYRGRYEFLDAFADDIDEIRTRAVINQAVLVDTGPPPKFGLLFDGEPLFLQLFPEQGIARFWIGQGNQQGATDRIAAGATIGGLLGTAVTAASRTKEGLLGGLILGMLVGGVVGAAAEPVERVLALQFDPATGGWRLYDGQLLRWAKRTLHPAA